jgi:hypothetical protein
MEEDQGPSPLRRPTPVARIRKAGGRILSGEARDVVGGPHRLLQRLAREIRAAGVAAALADEDGDAERLVAVALDMLERAFASRHRQPRSFRHLGRRIAGTDGTSDLQHILHQRLELLARIGESLRGGGRGHERVRIDRVGSRLS